MNEIIIKKLCKNTDLQKELITDEIGIVYISHSNTKTPEHICFTFLNNILFYFYHTPDTYDTPITCTTGKTPYVMLLNRT